MLFDIDKITKFFHTLLWTKTSVIEGVFAFPKTKQVAQGVLFYENVPTEIKVYTCDDILFQDKTSLIGFSGNHLELVFDKGYFGKLMTSKFKSAFFGACAIQVARYILFHGHIDKSTHKLDFASLPPCLPSHKPEIADFFFRRAQRNQLVTRRANGPTATSYARFIAQAILRGGYDMQEFTVDKKALSFFPIDDVLAAHAVDVETWNNLFISAERVNRIRALHHYYETDLTQWDGCELQIDLL